LEGGRKAGSCHSLVNDGTEEAAALRRRRSGTAGGAIRRRRSRRRRPNVGEAARAGGSEAARVRRRSGGRRGDSGEVAGRCRQRRRPDCACFLTKLGPVPLIATALLREVGFWIFVNESTILSKRKMSARNFPPIEDDLNVGGSWQTNYFSGVAQVGDRLSRRQFCDWLNIDIRIVEEFVADLSEFFRRSSGRHPPASYFPAILENFLEFFCPVPFSSLFVPPASLRLLHSCP
jgi:hypothetical protein